ncbi:hypothetical protein Q6350_10265 [Isoptericola sp. b515]|uniref:hypothetical protein n=1 Tax=Isoptericola sp. b515 TaxID=3064652 RepID=UPI0027128AAF|nr:hypothetical protein [Isoptericola sp. b515]MDO8148815.1 hypothetical protein [Isoptericola sp. b515]
MEQILADERNGTEQASERNEAQTRFDLIDHILKDVLNWPQESIRVEQHVHTGFTDYELHDVGTIAILEAKREGIGFTIPADIPSGTCRIEPLVTDPRNRALKDAMMQVMQYASARGTAPCIVSNGNQWVAFLGSRNDGVPPLEGKALVFPDLESIRDSFLTFHGCLSEPGIRARRLFSELSIGAMAPPSPLSAGISGYPGTKSRNTVQSTLQILGQVLLEDMPQEEKYSELFLEQCYATSGALSSYAQVSKELLKSRNAALLSQLGAVEAPAASKKGVNPEISAEALAAAAAHRPIVLLGGVGVGKSTFIQHLISVDAKAVFQNAIAIMVDYGKGATFTSPTEFAIEQIHSSLLEEHGIDVEDRDFVNDLYRKELARFDHGIYGELKEAAPNEYVVRRIEHLDKFVSDRSAHLRRSIERISKSHRKQVIIFLDNVDQRDHEDQNKVFLAANELAANWQATVFVALRPETYYESLRYGAVSGYHPRVFSISPPRSDVMLKKRIKFALDVLESGSDARTSTGVGFESENLERFLNVLDVNFSRNRPLMTLIDNLAGGNMRRALDFVTQFIGSGHVDTEKIIAIERQTPGEYYIPLHEFLRSLLHGDGEYYDPQVSPIANLYALDRPVAACHFLIPISLRYARLRGDAKDSSGFVELADLYQHLQGLGFEEDAITFALSQLGHHRLVEAPLDDFDPRKTDRARVTTVGAYTLLNLPRLFTYNDAVVVDTPILTRDVRHHILDTYNLADRIARAKLFREYLDQCWTDSGLAETEWEWPAVSIALQKDIDAVARRAGIANSHETQ